MRNPILVAAVLGALTLPVAALAEEAVAPAAESPHTFTYNVGLYSQYIFRGLTQTRAHAALQGGVDYSHASGFYLGAWGSNISWLTDANVYANSSLELDLYGGFASEIGETGIGYNVGILQYIYPGNRFSGTKNADTTEIYGSLAYGWVSAKLSAVASSNAFGFADADGSTYSELNLNVPFGKGYTGLAHVGYQDFTGAGNSTFDYTDWKLGLTKSWDNGVNIGGYYTATDGKLSRFTDASGYNIAKDQFTVFVQKTF
ncbi:TorF family putative porin [Methylobacillus flagellatus]|uniref:TorF family putative porin n=1 Tax=Methylobacillus flagellatus TaxID=405 RepID=UPI0010F9574D|nr:TorF family putative porin [Methylobacillus flagellatus]